MPLLNFEGIYKKRIIDLLLKDELIVKLINPTPNPLLDDIIDVLTGGQWIVQGKQVKEQGHIFDHDFVDDTITEEKTFIFVETNIPYVSANCPLTDFYLYVTVFANNNLVNLTSSSMPKKSDMRKLGYIGNRIDILCAVIDKILNGNNKIGIGKVMPSDRNFTSIYKPKVGYYGKQLRYFVKGYNTERDSCDFIS